MQVSIIGAGIGGIASAIRLANLGHKVTVIEANNYPGGKLSQIKMNGFRFDAGPSLFTLPHYVDELFELCGEQAQNSFNYFPLQISCRYFYEDGSRINAFQDVDRFCQEVEANSKDSAHAVKKYLNHCEQIYNITSHVFLERSLHKLSTYLRVDTLKSVMNFYKIHAFRSMHMDNQKMFKDPKVIQLFDRYATYNGSNPYKAPATLNVISHIEHGIGAFFPEKGMYDITQSLYKLAIRNGVDFIFGQKVDEILVQKQSVQGVRFNEEFLPAEVVISNMDVVPTYRKLLPKVKAPETILNQARSSSALIFYWGMNRFFDQLDIHNIFFTTSYKEEMDCLWNENGVYEDPTVYVYISSKVNADDAPTGKENWFVMINVPPDTGQDWDEIKENARKNILVKLSKLLETNLEDCIETEASLDPRSIEKRTSSFQGALYGNSSNNLMAAFLRHPNFSRRIKGLYFCGGSVHPGGGVPLCLLSAKIVADLVGSAT